LCTTVVHNTAQNSSDNLPSYPPDNHHSSDDVYWRGREASLAHTYNVSLCQAIKLPCNFLYSDTKRLQ